MLSRRIALRAPRLAPIRALVPLRLAHKEAQDKDSMRIESNEYSKTGSDAQAAQSDEAFDGSKTRPSEEPHDDSLKVSPANKGVGATKGEREHGAQSSSRQSGKGSSDRDRTSGGSEGKGDNKSAEGKRYD